MRQGGSYLRCSLRLTAADANRVKRTASSPLHCSVFCDDGASRLHPAPFVPLSACTALKLAESVSAGWRAVRTQAVADAILTRSPDLNARCPGTPIGAGLLSKLLSIAQKLR